MAVAAAAVVAESVAPSVDGIPRDMRQRIAALGLTPDQARELAPTAAAVLDRVEADDSELLELGHEAGEADDFRRGLQTVRASLSD